MVIHADVTELSVTVATWGALGGLPVSDTCIHAVFLLVAHPELQPAEELPVPEPLGPVPEPLGSTALSSAVLLPAVSAIFGRDRNTA